MKKIFIYACAAILIAQFASCSKKDSSTPKSTSLIVGTWNIVDIRSNIYLHPGDTTLEIFAYYPTCAKDDYYTFNADGSMQYNYGAQKCDTSEPQAISYKWKLDNTSLTISDIQGKSGIPATILKLTADTLQFSAPATLTNSSSTDTVHYISTETFVRG